ncbi:MAG: hypothetical protein Q6370_009025 [Candidatus Sigynarchaeota archaeon]
MLPQDTAGKPPVPPRVLVLSIAIMFLATIVLQRAGDPARLGAAGTTSPIGQLSTTGTIRGSGAVAITLAAPANTTYASGAGIPLTVQFNATVDASWYQVDGGASVAFTTNTTLGPVSDGAHRIVVYCNDSSGQVSQSAARWFSVDSTPPVLGINAPANTTYRTSDFARYPPGTYPGTETFDGYAPNEMPKNFSLYHPYTLWQVEDQHDNHHNVFRFWSNVSASKAGGVQFFYPLPRVPYSAEYKSGIYEFWFKIETAKFFKIESFFEILFWSDGMIYAYNYVYNGVPTHLEPTGLSWTNHTWYHLRVVFDGMHPVLTDCRVSYYLNQTLVAKNKVPKYSAGGGDYIFRGDYVNIVLDAFGFHKLACYEVIPPATLEFRFYWDPAYSLGSNLFDLSQLPINFTSSEPLAWCAYSLDGAANVTLQGNASIPLPAPGPHVIQIFARDATNHLATSGAIHFTIADTVPPACTIASPLDQVYTSRTGIPLQLSFSEPVAWAAYSINGGANVTFTGNTTIDVPGDGEFTLVVHANDTFGNTGTATRHFAVDTLAPAVQILQPLTSAVSPSTSIFLSIRATDPRLDKVWYAVNGSANVTFSGNASISLPGDGWWSIAAWANDTLGHVSSAVPVLVLVDTVLPQLAILAPGNLSTFTTGMVPYTIQVVEKNLDSIWYVLDGGAPVRVAGNGSIAVPDGVHVLVFRANDTAGHASAPATVQFGVDTMAPVVTITSPAPGAALPSGTVWLGTTVVDANLDRAWYDIDGGPSVVFSGNASISLPGDGYWTIHVRANDTYGHVSTVQAVTVLVDTACPRVAILAPANLSLHASSGVPFVVEAIDDHLDAIWYVVDGGAPVAFLANGSISFTDGPHEIRFFANDTAGNTNASAILRLNVDTAAPAVSILAPAPGSYHASTSIFLGLRVLDPNLDRIWYSVGTGTNTTFGGNGTIGLPGEGDWTIHAWANDTLGHASIAVSVLVHVDTTFPVIAIISPANHTRSAAGTIAFTVQVTELHPGQVWYRVDGAGTVPFPANTSIAFADGDHAIEFFASDLAGNTASTGLLHVHVDTADPAITIVAPVQNGNYSSPDIALAFTIAEPNLDTAWYRLNGSASIAIAGNGTITVPGEGCWRVDLYANDTFGRVGMASVTFNVGLTPPTIAVLTPINNTRAGADFLVSLSITSRSGHVSWVEFNGAAGTRLYFTGNAVTIPLARLHEGRNELVFYVNDSFGHVASTGVYVVEKEAVQRPGSDATAWIVAGSCAGAGVLVPAAGIGAKRARARRAAKHKAYLDSLSKP